MILEQQKTTVAYRCPECGAGVLSAIDTFSLVGHMVKLKCDCGGSEMTMVHSRDGEGSRVRFSVPCMICPNPHSYTVSSSVFFNDDIFSLPCQLSGINVAMMGDINKVKAELSRSELELIDALEKSGVSGFDALKGEEDMSDPQVTEIITYVIRELDEEGKIKCRCEEGSEREYELEFLAGAIRLSCKKCGASKEISTGSLVQAHDFLNADSLTLE